MCRLHFSNEFLVCLLVGNLTPSPPTAITAIPLPPHLLQVQQSLPTYYKYSKPIPFPPAASTAILGHSHTICKYMYSNPILFPTFNPLPPTPAVSTAIPLPFTPATSTAILLPLPPAESTATLSAAPTASSEIQTPPIPAASTAIPLLISHLPQIQLKFFLYMFFFPHLLQFCTSIFSNCVASFNPLLHRLFLDHYNIFYF